MDLPRDDRKPADGVYGRDAVDVGGVGKVTLRRAASEALELTADDNILPLLTSEVSGRELRLGIDDDINLKRVSELRYDISFTSLDRIELGGVTNGELVGVDSDSLDIRVAGVSNLSASGRIDRQTIEISGVSSYDARDLDSRIATVRIGGPSRAVVRVSDRLNVEFSGSISVVEYIGDPEVTVSGNGAVRRIG